MSWCFLVSLLFCVIDIIDMKLKIIRKANLFINKKSVLMSNHKDAIVFISAFLLN